VALVVNPAASPYASWGKPTSGGDLRGQLHTTDRAKLKRTDDVEASPASILAKVDPGEACYNRLALVDERASDPRISWKETTKHAWKQGRPSSRELPDLIRNRDEAVLRRS
jgi:hypothetical protein